MDSRRFRRRASVVSVVALALTGAFGSVGAMPVAAQVEVTSCGQIVSDAYLAADLDCSGFHDPVVIPGWVGRFQPPTITTALVVRKRGSLDLRGHTLTANERGVYCLGDCTILGSGGTITAATVHGIDSDYANHVRVTGLTITGSEQQGIWARRRLTVTDSTIRDNPGRGIFATGVKLFGTIITGNGSSGVFNAGGVTLLRGSQVSGNCAVEGFACSSLCADLVSPRKPRLKDSSCGVSRHELCASWHVCAAELY